jgi:hypothetical protein
MSIKMHEFICFNKDVFLKTAKDVYAFHKDIIQECIEKYKCPDVFKEMEKEGQDITYTKFFLWWNNKKRIAKEIIKNGGSISITKQTKEIVKKEIIKEQIANNWDKKEATKDKVVFIEKLQTPITQTFTVNKVYHKVVFKTEMGRDSHNRLNNMLKDMQIKSEAIKNIYNEFVKRLQNTHDIEEVNFINKKLVAYERLHKMMSESFVDSQQYFMQLRMLIENEKQIYENNLYEQSEEDQVIANVLAIAQKEIESN